MVWATLAVALQVQTEQMTVMEKVVKCVQSRYNKETHVLVR